MLYFISVWTLLLIGCCSCGLGLRNRLEISLQQQDSLVSRLGDFRVERLCQHAIISTWLGMLAIAIILLATGLFMPLSPSIGGIILSVFLLISLQSRSTRLEILALYQSISRIHLAIYLSVTIAIAALFSQPVQWYDSGLYHYSSIRWLANFGTVPGLYLLFPNFGFTSAWFAFSAPLNPNWAIDRTGATANGFVFLLAALQLLTSIWRSIRKQGQLSDWFVGFYYSYVLLMTIGIPLMQTILISPSPDLPALLLVGITTWAILVVETDSHADRFTPNRQLVPLLLAVGAVSIKLTALPLLLVTGLWFMFRAGFDRQVIQRIGIAAVVSLLLLPLLTSSIVTSGCPLYPSSTFCLDLPWAVGNSKSLVQPLATKVANATHHWISWYGTPPVGVNPWLWAFQLWFQKAGNKFIIAMMAISAGCGIYLLKTRASSVDRLSSIWLMTIAIAGNGFFLLTSPLTRFMMPYLFLVPALAMAVYCHAHFSATAALQQPSWSTKIVNKLLINQLKTATILLGSIATIATATQVRSNYSLLILPPSLDRIATVKRQMNDVIYFSPVGGENKGCWTIELPCAYNPVQIKLRNPREGIKTGFLRK